MERALGRTHVWNQNADKHYRGDLAQQTLNALVSRGWATFDAYQESIWLTEDGVAELQRQIDKTKEAISRATDETKAKKLQERLNRLQGTDVPNLADRAKRIKESSK